MAINYTLQHYVLEQLLGFASETRCCLHMWGSFCSSERTIFVKYAFTLGFSVRLYINNGAQNLVIHKEDCVHFLTEVPFLHIHPSVEKELLLLQNDCLPSQCGMSLSSPFLNYGCYKPVIPPHRFSLGLKQSIARYKFEGNAFKKSCLLQSYKMELLNALQSNRVLVVNGDPSFETIIMLPLYIVEESAQLKSHCKIICVERNQLLAIYNSEQLADALNEKLGGTVAFQIYLQSRISDSSNIIYTTASFLLRVLMGQNRVNSFRHISHVIVSDVHLHQPFSDLLLTELKKAVLFYTHIKIILLSNSEYCSEFLTYFGEGSIFQLENCGRSPNILYMDEIHQIIGNKREQCPSLFTHTMASRAAENYIINNKQLDCCLENYEYFGDDDAFNSFLYMVHCEKAPVNYSHSIYGTTAVNIAAKLGNIGHLRVLLLLHADPFIKDERNMNAMSNAMRQGHVECVNLLKTWNNIESNSVTYFDYTLIMDLLLGLMNNSEWKPGHILIFLPSREHILRLHFSILRHKMIGNLPQYVSVYTLHSNIRKEQLKDVIKASHNGINVILSTDIAQNIKLSYNITYIIDSARTKRSVYNAKFFCNQNVLEWVSKEELQNRATLVHRNSGKIGTCFRMISKSLYKKLSEKHSPELLTMSLGRICLTVKLISPQTMIAEYLQHAIVRPPFIHVHQAIEYLKKIEILDTCEDVTWLGCRLIDIPIDCQLGKCLIYAILLQCLDPVLTILSCLSTFDPIEFSCDEHKMISFGLNPVYIKIQKERSRLSEGLYSDHLIYLRLYQEWQDGLCNDNSEMALLDESTFVFNGILENVSDMRTHLVGALRSSQLIHNQGQLNMHYVNQKSNSWPMIKATLVGGLYPNICAIDRCVSRLKSIKSREIVLHPSSVLRALEVKPLHAFSHQFPSHWIIYTNEFNSANCNSISCCTLVVPLVIAMFAERFV